MIYVYQLLRQVRLDNKYNANAIAKRLGITDKEFRDYESRFQLIPGSILSDWLDEIDIPSADHAWYIQRHKREYVYNTLSQNITTTTDKGNVLLAKLADVLVFFEHIDISLVSSQLTVHTLPHILPKPRSADIATDNIKDSDK